MTININGIRYIRLADVLAAAKRRAMFVRDNAILDENKQYVDPCDKAAVDAINKLFYEIAEDEVGGDSKEELLELEQERYKHRYAVMMTSDGKHYYFRKFCAGAVAARMTEEGKSAEEIEKAVDDGETLPVFGDRKFAKLFDNYFSAECVKTRCAEEGLEAEIVPAMYAASNAVQKNVLEALFRDDAE